MKRAATSAILAAGLIGVAAATADAQSRRDRGFYEGSVTACSRYGNGCVSGPVRRGPVGFEVRMPGGTWISCRRDCREALREEVVDFWETLRERQPSGPFSR